MAAAIHLLVVGHHTTLSSMPRLSLLILSSLLALTAGATVSRPVHTLNRKPGDLDDERKDDPSDDPPSFDKRNPREAAKHAGFTLHHASELLADDTEEEHEAHHHHGPISMWTVYPHALNTTSPMVRHTTNLQAASGAPERFYTSPMQIGKMLVVYMKHGSETPTKTLEQVRTRTRDARAPPPPYFIIF